MAVIPAQPLNERCDFFIEYLIELDINSVSVGINKRQKNRLP